MGEIAAWRAGYEILKPMEPGKTYAGRYKITGILDKGTGKGALLFMRKELREKGDESLVSTVDSTLPIRLIANATAFCIFSVPSGGGITHLPAKVARSAAPGRNFPIVVEQ